MGPKDHALSATEKDESGRTAARHSDDDPRPRDGIPPLIPTDAVDGHDVPDRGIEQQREIPRQHTDQQRDQQSHHQSEARFQQHGDHQGRRRIRDGELIPLRGVERPQPIRDAAGDRQARAHDDKLREDRERCQEEDLQRREVVHARAGGEAPEGVIQHQRDGQQTENAPPRARVRHLPSQRLQRGMDLRGDDLPPGRN
jgi:hypothetical protein